jgi:hypothetical protein
MSQQDWHERLSALVDSMIDAGDLHDKAWISAFTDTPRHLFTPHVTITTPDGYRELSGDDPADRDRWLSLIYSDLGQPDRFGVVANRTTQFVWFGDDDSWHRWPLPLT